MTVLIELHVPVDDDGTGYGPGVGLRDNTRETDNFRLIGGAERRQALLVVQRRLDTMGIMSKYRQARMANPGEPRWRNGSFELSREMVRALSDVAEQVYLDSRPMLLRHPDTPSGWLLVHP